MVGRPARSLVFLAPAGAFL
jgi:hypothetical protein